MKVYIVPTDRWYIERAVWLIAGFVLLVSTAMALLANRLWISGVIATGLVSINVAFTGFSPRGQCTALVWLYSDARVRQINALGSLLHADRQMVSRTPHLPCGWH